MEPKLSVDLFYKQGPPNGAETTGLVGGDGSIQIYLLRSYFRLAGICYVNHNSVRSFLFLENRAKTEFGSVGAT